MLFDILENLEWYVNLYPSLKRVIGIMDRSLPYQDEPGAHQVDGIFYEVLSYQGGSDSMIRRSDHTQMHCILEGEELLSLEENEAPSVVIMATEVRFVILREGESYKSSMQMANDRGVKKVIFTL
jgi:beta-galactosidase beta subunit